jgi:hypothetical protein
MRKVWLDFRYGFDFSNDKLTINVKTNNPVYGKECHVRLKNEKSYLLVYSCTQSDSYDKWIHYNSKLEQDCIEILKAELKRQTDEHERSKKEAEEREKQKKEKGDLLVSNYK